jgi:hypothetical protein
MSVKANSLQTAVTRLAGSIVYAYVILGLAPQALCWRALRALGTLSMLTGARVGSLPLLGTASSNPPTDICQRKLYNQIHKTLNIPQMNWKRSYSNVRGIT